MTYTFSSDEHFSAQHVWIMTLAIPILLAAGAIEQSRNHITLPEEESYRSDFSETILESTDWRKPPPPTVPWRETPQPKLEWRTPQGPQPPTSPSRNRIELFPEYRPGRATDFDHITREEKPLIKIFEFGR